MQANLHYHHNPTLTSPGGITAVSGRLIPSLSCFLFPSRPQLHSVKGIDITQKLELQCLQTAVLLQRTRDLPLEILWHWWHCELDLERRSRALATALASSNWAWVAHNHRTSNSCAQSSHHRQSYCHYHSRTEQHLLWSHLALPDMLRIQALKHCPFSNHL